MKKQKNTAPQTSADGRSAAERAVEKLRDEMAAARDKRLQLLGEGVTVMLQVHPDWSDHILKKDKTLSGALEAIRRKAVGGCSDPILTTRSLCGYYGIPCDDPRRLGLEVTGGLMAGGKAGAPRAAAPAPAPAAEADPFDLDALMGGA